MDTVTKLYVILRDSCRFNYSLEELLEEADTLDVRKDLGLNEHNAIDVYLKLKNFFPNLELTSDDLSDIVTVRQSLDLFLEKVGE